MAFLAEHAGELVHDAAVHAAVVVLGALAYLGELEFVDGVAVEEVVECEGEARLQGCRRAEACAVGHIAGEGGVEAVHLAAALLNLAAHAEDVAGPGGLGSVLLAEAELAVSVVEIDADEAHFVGAVGLDFGHYHLVDGAGKYEAAVVVGVFANEVDAACRGVKFAFGGETLLKRGVHFFF